MGERKEFVPLHEIASQHRNLPVHTHQNLQKFSEVQHSSSNTIPTTKFGQPRKSNVKKLQPLGPNAQSQPAERIQVAIRVRPLHPELELGHENVISQPLQNQIQVKSDLHYDMRSQFDYVFNNATQDEVYE